MLLEKYGRAFCVWKFGPDRGSKPAKVPVNPNTGCNASAANPASFGTWEEANTALGSGLYKGIGLLMTGSELLCIDLDGLGWLPECKETGELPEDDADIEVLNWVYRLHEAGAFVEVSQSGEGLHLWFTGEKPEGCKQKTTKDGRSVEAYDGGDVRYLAITGETFLQEPTELVACELELLREFLVWAGLLEGEPAGLEVEGGEASASTVGADAGDEPEGLDAAWILQRLKQANKRGRITKLIDGDCSEYGGDQSAADMAMFAEIAFYTSRPELAIAVFKQTKLADTLGRKGGVKRQAEYLKKSAEKAIESCHQTYWEVEAAKQQGQRKAASDKAAIKSKLLDGGEGLVWTRAGRVSVTQNNVVELLRNWKPLAGVFAYNLLSHDIEKLAALPLAVKPSGDSSGPLAEHDAALLRTALSREFFVEARTQDIHEALCTVGHQKAFNPITDVLDTLVWDGQHRLDTWLEKYLGVKPERDGAEYTRAVAAKTLIACVARAYRPGAKHDCMTVLEGAQGAGKSTAVAILAKAICPDAFVENLDLTHDRESRIAIRGKWLAEYPELAGLNKKEAEEVKAFLSTTEDSYRTPYARRTGKVPRTVCIIGTCNPAGLGYINDVTGARRFWPVECGKGRLDKLQRDVLQLWAEAVVRYRNGEAWWFEPGTIEHQQAIKAQSERVSVDALSDDVEAIAEKLAVNFPEGFLLMQVWREMHRMSYVPVDFPVKEQNRLGRLLSHLGYKKRKSNGKNLWFKGAQ